MNTKGEWVYCVSFAQHSFSICALFFCPLFTFERTLSNVAMLLHIVSLWSVLSVEILINFSIWKVKILVKKKKKKKRFPPNHSKPQKFDWKKKVIFWSSWSPTVIFHHTWILAVLVASLHFCAQDQTCKFYNQSHTVAYNWTD